MFNLSICSYKYTCNVSANFGSHAELTRRHKRNQPHDHVYHQQGASVFFPNPEFNHYGLSLSKFVSEKTAYCPNAHNTI